MSRFEYNELSKENFSSFDLNRRGPGNDLYALIPIGDLNFGQLAELFSLVNEIDEAKLVEEYDPEKNGDISRAVDIMNQLPKKANDYISNEEWVKYCAQVWFNNSLNMGAIEIRHMLADKNVTQFMMGRDDLERWASYMERARIIVCYLLEKLEGKNELTSARDILNEKE